MWNILKKDLICVDEIKKNDGLLSKIRNNEYVGSKIMLYKWDERSIFFFFYYFFSLFLIHTKYIIETNFLAPEVLYNTLLKLKKYIIIDKKVYKYLTWKHNPFAIIKCNGTKIP